MSFKLIWLQLGFTCSIAADKLRFILLDSQSLRAFNQGFSLFFFFFWFFYFRKRKSAEIYMKNIHFLSSSERPMETSWRNTASRHGDNVHVYDNWSVWGYFSVDQPTSTCFKWHTSISVYLQRTSGYSNSMKEGAALGIYAHDLRYMFKVASSSPPLSLIHFFLKDDNQRRDFSLGYCS